MRYRKLTATGDYRFGQGQADFYIDQPEAVAQAVATRLRLQLGDWFLDLTDGMDWRGKVLGNRTAPVRDITIHSRVLATPHLKSMSGYSSGLDPDTRAFRAQFTLDTDYGPFSMSHSFVVPDATPGLQPPARPFDVNATPIGQTQAEITWQGG